MTLINKEKLVKQKITPLTMIHQRKNSCSYYVVTIKYH